MIARSIFSTKVGLLPVLKRESVIDQRKTTGSRQIHRSLHLSVFPFGALLPNVSGLFFWVDWLSPYEESSDLTCALAALLVCAFLERLRCPGLAHSLFVVIEESSSFAEEGKEEPARPGDSRSLCHRVYNFLPSAPGGFLCRKHNKHPSRRHRTGSLVRDNVWKRF